MLRVERVAGIPRKWRPSSHPQDTGGAIHGLLHVHRPLVGKWHPLFQQLCTPTKPEGKEKGMIRDQAAEVMRQLVHKYKGQEEPRYHKSSGLPYVQFRILGWNNNLDFFPGSLSVRVLTVQSGGTGMQGKRPRTSRADLSKRFGVQEEALLHREWGQGKYRSSVGVLYSMVQPTALRDLMEWALVKYGKKWDEVRHVHEKLCIDIVERILGSSSEREATPPWLSTGTRGSQRLDGYWHDLNLAVEYHGMQHFEMVSYFHRNDESNFRRQVERDEKKRAACREHGVDLIEVPYRVDLTVDSVRGFIRQQYPGVAARLRIDAT